MNKIYFALFASLASLPAIAQNLKSVYNRDTGYSFEFKNCRVRSEVKGPIVVQKSEFRFENPYKELTEASINFSLPWPAVLREFAYWYKDEYVKGILMDKQKAWFIYTAITSRNEDPGIMVQHSPSSYHAQIYPLAVGHDLRTEFTTVGFLKPDGRQLMVPELDLSDMGYGAVPTSHEVTVNGGTYRLDQSEAGSRLSTHAFSGPFDVLTYSEKFKDGYTYVAGMIYSDLPDEKHWIKGLKNVRWTRPESTEGDGTFKIFVGRKKGTSPISIMRRDLRTPGADRLVCTLRDAPRGSDTSKLWAHQMLSNDSVWKSNRQVLKFSLKYGIPSSQTALLAVPQEQMKLFKQKAAEYARKKREEERQRRKWEQDRPVNWDRSAGGDPEIRIEFKNAKRVDAILPDGRTFPLRRMHNDLWGGNFDIPANAPEGKYTVTLLATFEDGKTATKTITYDVDRTAPSGSVQSDNGMLILQPNERLSKALAVFGDGSEERMLQTADFRFEIAARGRRLVRIVMVDMAHNVGQAR